MAFPATVLPDQLLSPEAYLLAENDNNTETRHEFVNGLVYAMTGASREHNLVTGWLYVQLTLHLRGKPCKIFQTDMKVKVQHKGDVRFYYPDLQVTCEKETDRYYNEHPCLIMEVLSDSTQRTDRTEKLLAYQKIDHLQEYVLLSQDSPYLEIYRRRTDWQRESYSGNQQVILESINLTLAINEIYESLET